eukprot:30497-Pelagococcus_subviridis.AAC.9
MNSKSAGENVVLSTTSGRNPFCPSQPSFTRPKCASSATRSGRPRANASAAAADNGGAPPASESRFRMDIPFTYTLYCFAARSLSNALPFASTFKISAMPTIVTISPPRQASHRVPSTSTSAKRGIRPMSSAGTSRESSWILIFCQSTSFTLSRFAVNFLPLHP